MDNEPKRKILIEMLKHITPEMQESLNTLKQGSLALDRVDFIWHFLLQSFATMGNARGWKGLIANQANYNRITFDALHKQADSERLEVFNDVLRDAKVRMPKQKAIWPDRNYKLILGMGGLAEAKRKALAQVGRESKIAFLKHFHGIGDKYARNIWMDVYHPDFHNSIAVDQRIKRITEELRYSFRTYEEQEQFYQEIAGEAKLQGWELDRLLYNYKDWFLESLRLKRTAV